MTAQTAQYDHIGSKYDEYAQTATLKRAEWFREFTWHPTEVAPEDVAHYGEAYWQDLHANSLVIGLVCQK